MMRLLGLCFVTLVCALDARAQSWAPIHSDSTHPFSFAEDSTTVSPDTSCKIHPIRLAVVGGATLGALIYSQIKQSQHYWGQPAPLHSMPLSQEYPDALFADKFGHLTFTSMAATLYRGLFEWTGIDSVRSQWYASGVALAYQLGVEVQDGMSTSQPYLGFSWGDVVADVAGAAIPLARVHSKFMQNFTAKISFNPYDTHVGGLLDDYGSVYHWLSIDIYNALPTSVQQWYPHWIGIAVGHGVKGLDRYGAGNHELYISLDWNLEALPGDSWFLRTLKRTLNAYHLPAPCVRILPNVVWYGLKF